MATDKPDPRPTASLLTRKLTVHMAISIPVWCLDNQSHALTHDQLKHLTGKLLSEAMTARLKELKDL